MSIAIEQVEGVVAIVNKEDAFVGSDEQVEQSACTQITQQDSAHLMTIRCGFDQVPITRVHREDITEGNSSGPPAEGLGKPSIMLAKALSQSRERF